MILAEAFMKRNDLKKQIATLTASATQNLWQDTSLPVNFNKGTKVNPNTAFEEIMKLMSELQALNTAIGVANLANNEILRELETTTAKISIVESILRNAELYPGDKARIPSYSSEDRIVENEWLIDPQLLQSQLKELQEKKRSLEKTLAHNNFTIQV